MPNDRRKPAPPAAQIESVETDAPSELPVLLKGGDVARLLPLADPVTLVDGLRQLQQWIPQFIQLTLREEQSMNRAAHLPPEFLAAGLHAAGVWEGTKQTTGMTAEELRELDGDTRSWDDVAREMRAVLKGIDDANLTRKHRLGRAILDLYWMLGTLRRSPAHAHLRPYYEEMKRAYRLSRKKPRPRKAAKKVEETGEGEE